MVGVPGRSKACITCKKRRRGCDSLRPRCTPCRKSGLECGGYENARLFINTSQGTWPQGSSYNNPPRNSSLQPGHQAVASITTHSQSLAQTAYEEQHLHLFLEAYLPQGYRCALGERSWTSVVRKTYRDDEALKLALAANGLAAIGKHTGEGWMTKESFRLYGRSLTELMKALQMPERTGKGSVLAAARLLSVFELFVGSNDESRVIQSQNWERHVNGELALLQARGPETYVRGDAHSMFADGRLNYYILSAKQRRKLFVIDPQWKTVPWIETFKTQKDLLLDILLEVPGVLGDYDRMSSCPDATAKDEQRDTLITKCWVLDQRLQLWAVSSTDPIGLHDIPTYSLDSPTLSHEQLALVEMKALYWSGCLLLYSTLNLALGICRGGAAIGLPERTDHTIYIRNIAGTVQFLLDPRAGMLGQHVAVWPLAMALQFCMTADPKPPELQSKEKAMLVESLEGPRGDGIRNFILSMSADSHRHPSWMNEMCGTNGIRARAKMWVGVGDMDTGWDTSGC